MYFYCFFLQSMERVYECRDEDCNEIYCRFGILAFFLNFQCCVVVEGVSERWEFIIDKFEEFCLIVFDDGSLEGKFLSFFFKSKE